MNWYWIVVKNYVGFNGRARRKEYWLYTLFNLIFLIIAMALDSLIGTNFKGQNYGLFYTLYSLTTLLPSIAVIIRRMHDVGKSGWFILIPIYNIILALKKGEKQTNQYGADPKIIN
jgi:uncharacterized membrane protein YhaH (DUF805 family)